MSVTPESFRGPPEQGAEAFVAFNIFLARLTSQHQNFATFGIWTLREVFEEAAADQPGKEAWRRAAMAWWEVAGDELKASEQIGKIPPGAQFGEQVKRKPELSLAEHRIALWSAGVEKL